MTEFDKDVVAAASDAKAGIGWVKTHVMISVALVCFILGAICGYLIHR